MEERKGEKRAIRNCLAGLLFFYFEVFQDGTVVLTLLLYAVLGMEVGRTGFAMDTKEVREAAACKRTNGPDRRTLRMERVEGNESL